MSQLSGSHIVVVDDDPEHRSEIAESLDIDGFDVTAVGDAREMRRAVRKKPADLLLLDLSLPGEDGLTITRDIRRESDVAIVMVTGRQDEIDRVLGLELGADDYVTKPFSHRELLARVRNLLRRTHGLRYPAVVEEISRHSRCYRFDGWMLDPDTFRLTGPDDEEHPLTTAEFKLLLSFVESPNRIHSREHLLDRVHGNHWEGYDRSIDGLVSRLRKVFDSVAEENGYIVTVRGSGYMFTPKVVAVQT